LLPPLILLSHIFSPLHILTKKVSSFFKLIWVCYKISWKPDSPDTLIYGLG
jgi:hypothetical protein